MRVHLVPREKNILIPCFFHGKVGCVALLSLALLEDHVDLDKGHYQPVCSVKLHSLSSTLYCRVNFSVQVGYRPTTMAVAYSSTTILPHYYCVSGKLRRKQGAAWSDLFTLYDLLLRISVPHVGSG